MTTSVDVLARRLRPGRSLLYCAALLPMAVASLLAVVAGRASVAARWWWRLRARPLGGADRELPRTAGAVVVVGHAVVSVVVGVVALIPFGVLLAFFFRGVLYGLVDSGPYDTSWGGPSRAGAWAAHFLISLPMAAVALLLLAGLAALHGRWAAMLAGRRPAAWVLAVTALLPVPAVALFVAWLHQV